MKLTLDDLIAKINERYPVTLKETLTRIRLDGTEEQMQGLAYVDGRIEIVSGLDEDTAVFVLLHELGHLELKHHRLMFSPASKYVEADADAYAVQLGRRLGFLKRFACFDSNPILIQFRNEPMHRADVRKGAKAAAKWLKSENS